MIKGSEEITKGLVIKKFAETEDYSNVQNNELNGIIWFKEDSFKGTDYDWLKNVFSKATKKQTLSCRGTPDFTVVKMNSEIILLVECKADVEEHSMFENLNEYLNLYVPKK